MAMEKKFNSFAEFYPFYLSEHSDPRCRAIHYIGSFWVIVLVIYALFSASYLLLLLAPLIGYGHAWVGHFVFEKNRPATFKHPFYSFAGDWVMLKDFLLGKFKK